MARRRLVLFRVASGPRRGYGHVVRAFRLARRLRADIRISIDGPVPEDLLPRHVHVVRGGTRLVDALAPHLVVLDTPVATDARTWLKAARRAGVPVASLHDRGIAPIASDLAIDGSLAGPVRITGATRTLKGPRYMVVDPAVAGRRSAPLATPSVVVAFGGGTRAVLARQVARAVRRAMPGVAVRIAGGFAPRLDSHGDDGIEWLGPQRSLVPLLSKASAAIVAGGVTLYEAAALGVPVVAVPVVAAQRPTVRAFTTAGLALTGATPSLASAAVAALLTRPSLGRAARARGPRLVDGHGASRVARELNALMKASAR